MKRKKEVLYKQLNAAQDNDADSLRNLNGYAYRYKLINNPEITKVFPGEICFSHFLRANLNPNSFLEFIFSLRNWEKSMGHLALARHHINENELNDYVKVLLNKPSHFKNCFKTRKIDVAWKQGIQMNTKLCLSNFLCGACILRMGWEHPNRVPLFMSLYEKVGVDIALILSTFFYRHDDGTYAERLCGDGHDVFGFNSIEGFINFLKLGLLHIDQTGYKFYRSTRTDERSNDLLSKLLPNRPNPIGWNSVVRYSFDDVVSIGKLLKGRINE